MPLLANKAQEEAIATINGHVLIVSCPGSGKTTTLVRRIHHMIEEGVDPESILMVTFTKDAALGMKEKYVSLFSSNPGVTFATIHSLCFNLLKREGRYGDENVLQEDKKLGFLFDRIRRMRLGNDAWDMAVTMATNISVVKNNYIDPAKYNPAGISSELFVELYDQYEFWRNDNGLIDFDDMLLQCQSMLQDEPAVLAKYQRMFRYIQCDEYQDTNYIQRDILYTLAAGSGNLCVVGDDDQSIYAFRGARPEIMLGFTKDFPDTKKIMMGTNYRSAQAIVDHAGRLILHNKSRYDKEFVSQRGLSGAQGDVIVQSFDTRRQEMTRVLSEIGRLHDEGVPYKEMAILFRTNQQAQAPVTSLSEAGIPYYSTETVKSIYESFIFSDIRDYVALSVGNATKAQFFNILNHPNRYFREQEFKSCDYSDTGLMRAARYILRTGESWQYEKAADNISDWMNAFGPGKVSMGDTPSSVMERMNGAVSIHYDKYLKEYATFRNLDYTEVRELYDTIVEDAKRFATISEWFSYGAEYARKLREESRKKDREGVVITTMHRSKGLEWKIVFIIDADEKITPHKKSCDQPEMLEEERRLFYVAMTRAKDLLYVFNYYIPSRFIEDFRMKAAVKEPPKKSQYVIEPKDVPKYFSGKPVEHKTFGKGKVIRYEPGKIHILFDKHGQKVLQFPETFAKGLIKYI